MSTSTRKFDRWSTNLQSSWAFQVFNKYNDELNQMKWSNAPVTRLTFTTLKSKKAKLSDPASSYLVFDVSKGTEAFKSLKEWSATYNKLLNWINLNSLLAVTGNLETYIATVVSLALESDPGVLFDAPKSIDGVALLKKGAKRNKYHNEIIKGITKGDWNSRISIFKKTFGNIPDGLEKNIADLEKIRDLRNKIGHAFGRDIEDSRNHNVKEILSMAKLRNQKLKDFQYTILSTAKKIDKYLLMNHIGEYQAIAYYHRIYPKQRMDIPQHQRAMNLKTEIGRFGDTSGKLFCKGLVKYYEDL